MIRPARPAALGLLLALAQAAHAQGPAQPRAVPAPARPRPPESPATDAAYEAARAAFEGLPEAGRRAVQDALVWTGDYNAVTAGTFGRRTYEGLVAWQRRSGLEPSGILKAEDRAALEAAGGKARGALRFTVQADGGSGAVIGVPERLLTRKSPLPRGTRWQSGDGRVTLDTASYPPGTADLDGLFERLATATPERRVTYKVKKPDFLVVTGETAAGRFYIRYAAGPQGMRGFTMSYDKALTAEVDRLVIAVANSFVPFPEAPAEAGVAGAATPFAPAPPPVASARPAATGLALGAGRVVTASAALDGCPSPVIGGAPARLVSRDASGALALLETEARAAPAVALPAIRSEAPPAGEALVVIGAEAGGRAGVAPGTAGAGGVVAPLQPGATGAPVLDRSGRLVGLVARFPAAPRLIAGIVPPTSYALVPAATVAAFLGQAGTAPGKAAPADPRPASLGAAAAPLLGSVVAVACGR